MCVQTVPQLVREGEHVAVATRPVQQHVGVMRRNRVGAEGARPLVVADGGVDPPLVEEPSGGVGELTAEGGVGVEHHLSGLVPVDLLVGIGDRGHPVVVGDRVTQDGRLQPVPALRNVVPRHHGIDEGLNRLVRRLVGEVPGRDPALV